VENRKKKMKMNKKNNKVLATDLIKFLINERNVLSNELVLKTDNKINR